MSQALPKHKKIVIIGGGVVGCSVAYHLTLLGESDVVVLERSELTCGTTWHAAGLVGQLRATENLTRLAQYTTGLYESLEQKTGQATGFKQNGSISIAHDAARLIELKRGADMAARFGLRVESVSADDIVNLNPLVNPEGIVGGVYLPDDGQTNPIDTTRALAKGARSGGATIIEGVTVSGFSKTNNRIDTVHTNQGDIQCELVVNCGGLWAHQIGRWAGTHIPLHAAEHFYVVTENMDSIPANMPVVRDPSQCIYIKEDAGKLLIGMFEPVAKPITVSALPDDFSFGTLPADEEHILPWLEKALELMPALESTGIQTWFNGPESFTPDDRYLLGPVVDVDNLYVAAGFNSIGIQSAGGAGKVLADWIVQGQPPMDLWDVDVRRTAPFQSNARYLHERTTETLGLLYAMHWPYRQPETARGVRRTAFYPYLTAAHGCFGELNGWERANWFGTSDNDNQYEYTFDKPNWFENSRSEHLACRQNVVLFDLSTFAIFRVRGAEALALLNRISTANIDRPHGKVIYTQWLNERGGIEADLTITRIDDNTFWVVTSPACHQRDLHWLRQRATDKDVVIDDITNQYAILGVMGPNAAKVMSAVSPASFEKSDFPFATSEQIELAMAYGRASRISYAGELGWELYLEHDVAAHVVEAVMDAGREYDITWAGMHALNSLRIEKSFVHYGHDIADYDDPIGARLQFTLDFDKEGGFIGDSAVQAIRDAGTPERQLVRLGAKDDAYYGIYHEEPIYDGGTLVGHISSSMYGHSFNRMTMLGWVKTASLDSSNLVVRVAGEDVAVEVF